MGWSVFLLLSDLGVEMSDFGDGCGSDCRGKEAGLVDAEGSCGLRGEGIFDGGVATGGDGEGDLGASGDSIFCRFIFLSS